MPKSLQGTLTFSHVNGSHICAEFVQGLDVLILFDRVEHDSTSRLQVCDTVLDRHCSDRDAGVHLIICKIESTNGTRIYAPSFALQFRN